MNTKGQDKEAPDELQAFLAAVRVHQEAIWAVLAHCNIVIGPILQGDFGPYLGIRIYRPTLIGDFNVKDWWDPRKEMISDILREAGTDLYPEVSVHVEPRWIMAVPSELADFVAKNTGRPMPGRFNSNLVRYEQRDSIIWLTPPEAVLYDYLKAAGWKFVPQPAVVLGDEGWLGPDFLIYWGGRANQAVMVEVDSDKFHGLPSQREHDENKERYFQSFGFEYLRFNATSCMREPSEVIAEIKKFCLTKFWSGTIASPCAGLLSIFGTIPVAGTVSVLGPVPVMPIAGIVLKVGVDEVVGVSVFYF